MNLGLYCYLVVSIKTLQKSFRSIFLKQSSTFLGVCSTNKEVQTLPNLGISHSSLYFRNSFLLFF